MAARRFSDQTMLNTLELWIVNTAGEIENENWRKRHAHEPHYAEQRELEIEQMSELAALLRIHIERRRQSNGTTGETPGRDGSERVVAG